MLRFLFLIFIFSLILINPTNADFVDKKTVKNNKFSATTLNFSQLKTTDNSDAENLFNINGILPGGYQVNTLRVKNQGETNLNYSLTFEKISGDDNFCRQLEINLIKDGQSKYQGNLVDLNLDNILDKDQNFSDWLVYLKLKDNYLSSKSEVCDFYLNINGFSNNQNQTSGFKYKRIILNHISST
jgi:hypothetical protein